MCMVISETTLNITNSTIVPNCSTHCAETIRYYIIIVKVTCNFANISSIDYCSCCGIFICRTCVIINEISNNFTYCILVIYGTATYTTVICFSTVCNKVSFNRINTCSSHHGYCAAASPTTVILGIRIYCVGNKISINFANYRICTAIIYSSTNGISCLCYI